MGLMEKNGLHDRRNVWDTGGFLEFSNEYGLVLFYRLKSRISEPELLRMVYESVLTEVHNATEEGISADDVESLLLAAADRACTDLHVPSDQPKGERIGGAGFWIAFALLLILNTVFLWVIAKLLMDMGFLPAVDLGYSWIREVLIPLIRNFISL